MAVVVAYLTCALVWGTTWFAIRVCIADGGYPTYEALAWRFVIATAVLIPICAIVRIREWPRGRAQWGWLVVAGLLDALGYTLVYLGEESVPGGLAAVVFGVHPLFLAILLGITGMERVTRGAVLGALISIAGIAVIFLDRAEVSAEQGAGIALILGSVLASTLYAMVMKRHGAGVHALAQTTIFLGVTGIALGAVALLRGPAPMVWPPPAAPTAALLYLAVMGSVVAFGTYFWLLRRLSLMATSTLVFLLPLVSLSVDALWEREVRLGGRAYLGVAITLSGLAVNLLTEAVRRRGQAPRSAGTT
jgi:drug/metabolite transporter (DMT)-like permease